VRLAVAPPVSRPLTPAPRGLIQRCACGGTPGPDGECAACKRKRLMRLANGPGPASPTPLVDAVVRSSGQPLDPGTRAFMESRFGRYSPPASPRPALAASRPVSRPGDPLEREAHRVAGDVLSTRPSPSGGGVDFSRVRVHTDERAAASARSVDADAYTVGSHVVFDRGRYAPATPSGRALIAHELAHVVQQGDVGRPAILRQAKCLHDGPPKGCGHAWQFGEGAYDPTDPTGRYVNVDRMIVDSFEWNLPGMTWAGEVLAPLNVLKSAKDSGRVDGLRVIESGPNMRFEVIEIKSRAKGEHGGCIRASLEAFEYVRVYNRIASRIVQFSAVAQALGGLRVRNVSSLTPRQRQTIGTLGFDLDHPDNEDAARFFFSLQNKLNNRVFTTAFASVEFDVFREGDPKMNYRAITVRTDCVTAKGRKREGLITLIFQLNNEGGFSYRCSTSCPEEDERRRGQQPELQPEARPERGTDVRRGAEAEGEEGIDEPRLPDQPPLEAPPPEQPSRQPQDRPGVKKQPPVQAPPAKQPTDQPVQETQPPVEQPGGNLQGVPELIVTLAAISQWRKSVRLAKEAGQLTAASAAAMERQLAKQTIEVIDEIGKKAPDVAKKLNGRNLAKYGTDAADDLLKAGAQEIDDIAVKTASRGGKALRALGALSKVVVVLGVLFTASEVYAMANHLRKGGDIRIGLGGPEAELVGETKITKRGQQFGQRLDIQGSGTLKDTIVDIDVTGLPDLSGKAQIHAENVTIRQAGLMTNGAPIEVNIRAKLKNTTIVIKHRARLKDGKAVIGGEAVDISGSNIEIDLPEGAMLPESQGRPMTNVNLKITEVPKDPSAAQGPAGKGGAGGPEATPTPTPAPTPTPEAKPKPEPDPAAKYKDLDDETREKIRTASKPVQTLFEDVTKPLDPKKKGVPVTNETVKRFYDTVPKDLTDAQLEALRKRMVPLPTDDVEAWFKGLADAVAAVQKPADTKLKGDAPGGAPTPAEAKEPDDEKTEMTAQEIFDFYAETFEDIGADGFVISWSAAEKRAIERQKKGEKVKPDREAVYLAKDETGRKHYGMLRVKVESLDKRANRITLKLLHVGSVIDETGAVVPRPARLSKDTITGKVGWSKKK
jgi:hypothetical protein